MKKWMMRILRKNDLVNAVDFTMDLRKRWCRIFTRLAVLFFLPMVMASCLSESVIIERASDAIKWEGHDTGIREQLNIDGFYYSEAFIGDSCIRKGDPQDRCGICFFDDGTFVSFNVLNPELHKKDKDVIWLEHSGVYTLSHDTIIVESFNRFDFPENLIKGINVRVPDLWRLKIIDRNTLEEIDEYDLMDKAYYNAPLIRSFGKFIDAIPFSDKTIYHFSDSYVFPTSDIKMKEKYWLWRNEEDWKKWMLHWKEQKYTKKPYIIKYHD